MAAAKMKRDSSFCTVVGDRPFITMNVSRSVWKRVDALPQSVHSAGSPERTWLGTGARGERLQQPIGGCMAERFGPVRRILGLRKMSRIPERDG